MASVVKGYLLIKPVPGVEIQCDFPDPNDSGYNWVNLVFGQWDAVATAEAKSLFEITKLIVGEVRGIQGVQDTTTLLQAEL